MAKTSWKDACNEEYRTESGEVEKERIIGHTGEPRLNRISQVERNLKKSESSLTHLSKANDIQSGKGVSPLAQYVVIVLFNTDPSEDRPLPYVSLC